MKPFVRVLVACEFSGKVRDAFLNLGIYAMSCDLRETISERGDSERMLCGDGQYHEIITHRVADVRDVVTDTDFYGEFDLMIAHPPCTYLCVSGLHWNGRVQGRAEKTEEALAFVELLMKCYIPKKAIENPVSCISTRIRKPDQIIQPHQFGHDASKTTCLWLEGLPPLTPTKNIAPRLVNGKQRWANQTDSGQNKLAPSARRSDERAITYSGIADAMAEQWGALL